MEGQLEETDFVIEKVIRRWLLKGTRSAGLEVRCMIR